MKKRVLPCADRHTDMRLAMMKLLGVMLALAALAAHPQTAAQTPTQTPPAANGRIAGIVVADDNSRPVRGAQVDLAVPNSTKLKLIATTDAQGRFAFIDLHPDMYRLTANRSPGFGSAHSAAPGGIPDVKLAPSQQVNGLTIRLARMGGISGTVRDESGQPLVGATVHLGVGFTLARDRRITMWSDAPQSSTRDVVTTTDDRGVYRLGGLGPGDYVVHAGPIDLRAARDRTDSSTITLSQGEERVGADVFGRAGPAASDTDMFATTPFITRGHAEVDRRHVPTLVRPMGVISGIVRDEGGEPADNVDVRLLARSGGDGGRWSMIAKVTTDDRGAYRISGIDTSDFIIAVTPPDSAGGASVVSESRGPLAADASELAGAFAMVFAPGTTTVENATRLTLQPGEERNGVDIFIPHVPAAVVTGRIFPWTAHTAVVSVFVDDPTGGGAQALVGDDGSFQLSRVAAGPHVLTACSTDSSLYARVPLVLGEDDVRRQRAHPQVAGGSLPMFTIELLHAAKVTGHAVLEPSDPPRAIPSFAFRLSPQDDPRADEWHLERREQKAYVQPDGTILFSAVTPGHYRIEGPSAGVPPSFVLLSAVVPGGRDVAEFGLDMGVEDVHDMVITFSDRGAVISGRTADVAGTPTGVGVVFAIPVDADGQPRHNRSDASALLNVSGGYQVSGLAPGTYRLIAISSRWPDVFRALESLFDQGTLVTVALGDRKTIDLVVR